MSEHGVDVHAFSDDQLAQLRRDVLHEQSKRKQIGTSPEKIERAIEAYHRASGKGQGEPWELPARPADAFHKGAEVTHQGKEWISSHSFNVGEPGVSGWYLQAQIDPETGEEIPPPFVARAGAHDAYEKGMRITWTDGTIREAARDGVVHTPDEYPDDWPIVEEDAEPDPPEDEEPVDPEEPTDPEGPGDGNEPEPEPAEPGTIDNPHTWEADVDYKADHYVTYDGALYRIRQTHKSAAHWLPSAVASLYKLID